MIEKFFARFIASVSEELLTDLFKAIVREIALKRKKADLSQSVADLKRVIEETAHADMSESEKNARLSDAGRAAINSLRDK